MHVLKSIAKNSKYLRGLRCAGNLGMALTSRRIATLLAGGRETAKPLAGIRLYAMLSPRF